MSPQKIPLHMHFALLLSPLLLLTFAGGGLANYALYESTPKGEWSSYIYWNITMVSYAVFAVTCKHAPPLPDSDDGVALQFCMACFAVFIMFGLGSWANAWLYEFTPRWMYSNFIYWSITGGSGVFTVIAFIYSVIFEDDNDPK